MVLPQVKKTHAISVPRLDADGKRTRALITTLVDESRGGVVRAEHGYDSVRVSIGASNVTDSAGGFADHGAAFEGVVDALDRVVFHADEEAGAQNAF